MTNETDKTYPFDRVEDIVNWTLPGLTMYYRDSNLEQSVIDKYEVRKIFRAQTFTDVSNYAGKPTKNCRFIFATSKAAPLYQINPETQKWGFHSINCNSYFKVLDVYKYEGITQIFLLHIPYKGIDFFNRTVLNIKGQNIEEQIIEKAKESLHKKYQSEIIPALEEKDWVHRTSFPIGLDMKNEFFSLKPTEPIYPMAVPMFSAIKKMTNDLTDLNEVPVPDKKVDNPISDMNKQKEKPKKKGGFWSNLFGKN